MERQLDEIDLWAMKQDRALQKQGKNKSHNYRRTRLQSEYNEQEFNKLFKETKA